MEWVQGALVPNTSSGVTLLRLHMRWCTCCSYRSGSKPVSWRGQTLYSTRNETSRNETSAALYGRNEWIVERSLHSASGRQVYTVRHICWPGQRGTVLETGIPCQVFTKLHTSLLPGRHTFPRPASQSTRLTAAQPRALLAAALQPPLNRRPKSSPRRLRRAPLRHAVTPWAAWHPAPRCPARCRSPRQRYRPHA